MKKHTVTFILAVFLLVFAASAQAQYTFEPSALELKTSPGSTVSGTFTVRNSGAAAMTNVIFAYDPNNFRNNDSYINLTFTPNTIPALNPGSSQLVTISASVPQNVLLSENNRIFSGNVSLLNAQAQATSFNLNLNVQNILRIKNIDISSDGKDTEITPGESFTVKVEAENTDDDIDLEDCEIKVRLMDGTTVLEDEDGDNVEDSDEINDLGSNDEETAEFTFNTPYDVHDDDEYTIEASVTCDQKKSTNVLQAVDTSEKMTVKKEQHKLEIYRLSLDQQSLACIRQTSLSVGVRNIGEKREEVDLTVKSIEFNMSRKSSFELDEDANDDDFEHVVNVPIDATGAAPGNYILSIAASYDDGEEKEVKTVSLEVRACPTETQNPTSNDNTNDNTKSDDNTNDNTNTEVEVIKAPVFPPQNGAEAKDISTLASNDDLLTALIVGTVGIIAIGFVIVVIRIASAPRRRY